MSGLLAAALAAVAAALALRPPVRPARSRAVVTEQRASPAWLLPLAAAVSAALGVTILVGGTVGPPLGAVAAGVAWYVVSRLEPPAQRRRRERLEAGLPHAVDLLAACLAAGQAPGPAVQEIARAVDGPLAEELGTVAARLRLGADPVTVWRDLSAHPQLGRLGRCVLRAVDSGASVAAAMSRLAEDLRRDARARVEARARAVGVKAAVPLGLCMLPAFVLVGVVPLVVGSLSALLTR